MPNISNLINLSEDLCEVRALICCGTLSGISDAKDRVSKLVYNTLAEYSPLLATLASDIVVADDINLVDITSGSGLYQLLKNLCYSEDQIMEIFATSENLDVDNIINTIEHDDSINDIINVAETRQ